MLDLILKNGILVDPRNQVHEPVEVGIQDGIIVKVEENIIDEARKYLNLKGRTIIPGLIDLHVHIGGARKRRDYPGLGMLAKTGVTTALDLGTKMEVLIDAMKVSGSGINMGGLHPLIPEVTVKDPDPGTEEIQEALDSSQKKGGLGFKIMGGHYPLTPLATQKAIQEANQAGYYVAFHAGTTETKSDLTGMREVPELVGKNGGLHLAHINAYCRGLVKDSMEEVKESFAILEGLSDRVVSESHLAAINGTSGACKDGKPVSHVTQRCLTMREYPPVEEGLSKAIREGYASVVLKRNGENILITGEEAYHYWREENTRVNISFPVTPPSTSFLCATGKNEKGDFIIDALTSDGGNYPRNIILERGLALCRLGALTLEELVRKITTLPAWMLGLTNRGHLGEGAIADITILDLERGVASMSLVGGEVVMVEGMVLRKGGTLLITKKGAEYVRETGLDYEVVNLEESALYKPL